MWWVEECGESECPAVMDGIRAATSPDAKAGRLPQGLSLRENFINLLKEGIADDYATNDLRGCTLTPSDSMVQY